MTVEFEFDLKHFLQAMDNLDCSQRLIGAYLKTDEECNTWRTLHQVFLDLCRVLVSLAIFTVSHSACWCRRQFPLCLGSIGSIVDMLYA
jgi:hypothetical protein